MGGQKLSKIVRHHLWMIPYGMKYLSIEVSAPVFNRVVIARVAMDRFESEISISRSILHAATALG